MYRHMDNFAHFAVATLLVAFILPFGGAVAESATEPAEPTGIAAVNAEIQTGIDAILSRIPLFSFVSDINKETFEQGETIELQLKDTAEYSCDDSVFVVEAYAPEPPSDREAEIRDLDHLTDYDPIFEDQLITAEASLTLPADAEPGEWTIVAYTYCYTENAKLDSGDDIVFKTVTVEESSSTSPDDTKSAEVIAYRQPSVSVENGRVHGTVYLENSGGADMTEDNLVEMQAQRPGTGLMSFVSSQQLCDPAHPENVHKVFRLNAGEKASIELSTSAVEPGNRYEVHFVTGTACADNGGTRTFPYGNGLSAGTVCVGDCGTTGSDDATFPWFILSGIGIILIGVGVYWVGRSG